MQPEGYETVSVSVSVSRSNGGSSSAWGTFGEGKRLVATTGGFVEDRKSVGDVECAKQNQSHEIARRMQGVRVQEAIKKSQAQAGSLESSRSAIHNRQEGWRRPESESVRAAGVMRQAISDKEVRCPERGINAVDFWLRSPWRSSRTSFAHLTNLQSCLVYQMRNGELVTIGLLIGDWTSETEVYIQRPPGRG